jgi:NAD(P)H-dependent FMN reductase
MEQPLIPVIYGSVRRDRQGIKAARYVVRTLQARGMNPVLIDPIERQLPLLDRMYKEYTRGEAPAILEELATLFRAADGFVIVSGEYNHSIPPALSNLLDHFLEEYFWRPAGIVSYSGGRFGGVRAAVQLRSMLAEMGMVTLPTAQPISQVQNAFDDDGLPSDPRFDEFSKPFFDELEWYVNALRAARAAGVPY